MNIFAKTHKFTKLLETIRLAYWIAFSLPFQSNETVVPELKNLKTFILKIFTQILKKVAILCY